MQPSFLDTPDTRLAYAKQEGAGPTIMFLSGFKSDMTGTKAATLASFCEERGQSFLRFDYSGHGQSGGNFMEGSIGRWLSDSLCMFDRLAGDGVILVGSSMGGWLALLMTLARPERVKALVGIATAPDFTERLIWDQLTAPQKEKLLKNGVYYAPSCYGEEPYPITLKLIEEGRNHLLLDKPLGISCPVHLLHGTKDADVPVEIAYKLKEKLPKAHLHIIEKGDHSLSSEADLALLLRVISGII